MFDKLKERLENPNYLSDLIEKYFLKNNHRVYLTLHPDNHLFKEVLHQEQEKLKKIQKDLTPEKIENIINKNVYPADKQDLNIEEDKGSAMSAMGLKPKIVH